jgi:hypothetical protein
VSSIKVSKAERYVKLFTNWVCEYFCYNRPMILHDDGTDVEFKYVSVMDDHKNALDVFCYNITGSIIYIKFLEYKEHFANINIDCKTNKISFELIHIKSYPHKPINFKMSDKFNVTTLKEFVRLYTYFVTFK